MDPICRFLAHVHAAIDVERQARDKFCLVARQKGNSTANMLRFAKFTQRNSRDQSGNLFC